jgi:hypothetical protein
MNKQIYFAVGLAIILLMTGTFYYNMAEGWPYVDAFYFSTMTLTTIGFGDLAPTNEASRIFTSFYALFGIGIMLYIITYVIKVFIFKQERYFGRAYGYFRKLGRSDKDLKAQDRKIEKMVEVNEKELDDQQRLIRKQRALLREQAIEIRMLEKKEMSRIEDLARDQEREKKELKKIEKTIRKIPADQEKDLARAREKEKKELEQIRKKIKGIPARKGNRKK